MPSALAKATAIRKAAHEFDQLTKLPRPRPIPPLDDRLDAIALLAGTLIIALRPIQAQLAEMLAILRSIDAGIQAIDAANRPPARRRGMEPCR